MCVCVCVCVCARACVRACVTHEQLVHAKVGLAPTKATGFLSNDVCWFAGQSPRSG